MRLQLALNVSDIDEAVAFYGRLFGVEPHKRRPGYANFEVAEPPLKLVLFEAADAVADGRRLNHLGVEVDQPAVVSDAITRPAAEGLATRVEQGEECCHAVQDKVWVTDPDGAQWEVYAITDDDPDGLGAGSACATGPGARTGRIPVAADGTACCS